MKVRFVIKEQVQAPAQVKDEDELKASLQAMFNTLDGAQLAAVEKYAMELAQPGSQTGAIGEERKRMTKKADLPAKLKRFVDRKQDQIRKFGKENGKSSDQITKFVSMMRDIAESSYDRYYGDGKRFEKMDDFMSYVARTINDKMPVWAMKGKPTKFHGPGKSGPVRGRKG
jgi:hypothetical protein